MLMMIISYLGHNWFQEVVKRGALALFTHEVVVLLEQRPGFVAVQHLQDLS